MIRSLSVLLTRPAALATSVALHVGAVIAGGHALSEATADGPKASAAIDVEVITEAPVEPIAARTPDEETHPDFASLRAGAVATLSRAPSAGHRHTYPVPPDHDAHPHDASLLHIIGGATPAPATPMENAPLLTALASEARSPEAAPSPAPLHFVLATQGVTTRGGAPQGVAGRAAASETPGANEGASGPIFPESAVDRPARLLSSVPVVYPEAARAAEIEADVLLELVVDGDGKVVSARPLVARDLGLADAAVRAVRAYRFTPALRAGREARVRMRWTVAFRLQ